MRLLSAALGVFLLLALLTWLLLRGIDTNAPAYAVTLQAFDDFALAEASLHRDVLQARAGLLRNYDTFAIAMEAMEDAVARLRSHAQAERLDGGPVDRLPTLELTPQSNQDILLHVVHDGRSARTSHAPDRARNQRRICVHEPLELGVGRHSQAQPIP